MESIRVQVLTICCLFFSAADGQESFQKILTDEITEAAKYYFANNLRLDGSGFNTIDEDEVWIATDLFRRQYGADASTARFVAGLTDFEYYELKNISFSGVTQLILVGEHRDARQGFAAYVEVATGSLQNDIGVIADVKSAETQIRSAFRSVYDVVGGSNFASFLNLELGSSLSFVMDTTGSMSDDIAAAKARVIEIIEITNGTNSAPLNYVLMPFNDPGFGPLTKTHDPATFIDAVNELFASGGGDGPELAMIGILKAAQASSFRSIVYVYTDATAKDIYLRDNVIAHCLTKKIAVFVFLTYDIASSERKIYDDIAVSTGGSVLYVSKADIIQASAIMETTTVQGLVTVKSLASSNSIRLTIDVDSTISSLFVQIIGTFHYLGFDGPNGTETVPIANISGATIFRINGVTAGAYTFKFDEFLSHEYGILIRGLSGLGFHARLQQVDPESRELTNTQQHFSGRSTKGQIKIYGDDVKASFERFQLIARNGDVLVDLGLEKTADKFYIVSSEFIMPERPSFVRINGTYDGMPFERIDPCAITPTTASSSLDKISDITIKAGETKTVTTVLKNYGVFDEFLLVVSDNQEYVTLVGAPSEGLTVNLNTNAEQTITLAITVPAGTEAGVLSKVILSATANNGGYFIFINLVVSVIDDIIRCPSPITPIGGRLNCFPDARSIGSKCTLQCGDEYILDGDSEITCQSSGTWSPEFPGSCRFLGSKTCRMSGDPHYTTFDDQRYDFQGSCLYTLVETLPNSKVEDVVIQVENGLYYGVTEFTWFQEAFITVYNTTIHLKQGRIVLVNGIRITLPRIKLGGRLQILYDGGDVLVKTDFKLEVRLNSRHNFRVSLPATYRNKVYGLCGNYDGERENDLQVNNITFTGPSEFGNSLEIPGGSKPWCRPGKPEDDEPGCNEAQRAKYQEKCALLKSTCFEDCADNVTVDGRFKDCVFDMCVLGGTDAILEGHLSDFATFCNNEGNQVCDWRPICGIPPPTCGPNEHYEFQGNRCPNTCVDPKAAERCTTKPKVEGCVCNEGFVLDGSKCVRQTECGCAVSGAYYKKGFSFVEEGCTRRCVCADGKLTCLSFSCDEGSICAIKSEGQYGCVAERTDQFFAWGDPHYKTLDGSYFDFMGICRYVILTTNGTALTDPNRHITITAQNEHRSGLTSVSYIRSVTMDLPNGVRVLLGPGTSIGISEPASAAADVVTVTKRGSKIIAATPYGMNVNFDGTNLFINVPNFYMRKVSGLCGSYTGMAADDFGNMTMEDFISYNRYPDDCSEALSDPPVCTEELRKKWAGPEYCGKMNDTSGPFSFCLPFVKVDDLLESCIFDACATEGGAIKSALHVLTEECKDRVPCDWEVQLGIAPICPLNSVYGCGLECQDTCRDPSASSECENTDEFPECRCSPGYMLDNAGGSCVKSSSCGCVLEDGAYVEQGYFYTTENCQHTIECIGPGSTKITKDPCTEDSECKKIADGEFRCIPNELSHVLLYGAIHFKTFDGYYFDYHGGNCTYLLVAHDSNTTSSPSFRVYIATKAISNGRTYIDDVIVENWWENEADKSITRVDKSFIYTVDGIAYSVGATIRHLTVDWRRGNLAFVYDFGVEIHFNGKDWIRVDVPHTFMTKMYGMGGNYNNNKKDDLLTLHTADEWGELWLQKDRSSKQCSMSSKYDCLEKPSPTESGCLLRSRYERKCYCGMIKDGDGPFSSCHEFIDPEPYTNACVLDACNTEGSVMAMTGIMKAYRLACLGKEILIRLETFTEIELEAASCPKNSHFSNCTGQSQPTCASPEPSYLTEGCEEGCVCNDGFRMSNHNCVPVEKCGCFSDEGIYYEHGFCLTNENCSQSCTCVYGLWNCEEIHCNEKQSCSIMSGIRGCFWKDPCKYNNGGCSDICAYNISEYDLACSCNSRRILTKDNKTCVEISPKFFQDGLKPDSCGVQFSAWKNDYMSWKNVEVPLWEKQFQEYTDYVNKGIVSAELDVCQYSWTEWYDRDDPVGCGDDESLEMLRSEHPEICEHPITAQARFADGRELRSTSAEFEVTERGVVCQNADQDHGIDCPDLAIRFLCRATVVSDDPSCE